MTTSFLRSVSFVTLAWALMASASAAPKYKTNLPPSAELTYSITAKQKGITLEGNGLMRWSVADNKFSASNEARAMLIGKILDAKTEGVVDANGLAPVTFTEKRFRRDPTTTTFDRASKTIRFTASDKSYPITGGEQDRNSTIWQLISVARAAPAKFKPGSSWIFFVAGRRDADQWTFKVTKREKIDTPLGSMDALHVVRVPPSDSKEQTLDIWLAPTLEWYPARLRFSEDEGDYIEQTLQKVEKKAS
ncbi:MAG TPA: DUF3108 domain-containing protein [Noviherbaspirillum sp.]|nr:DUF3108 domain-containing protein [Noviherbaspirillum sp.]